jgi:hypothetical protein
VLLTLRSKQVQGVQLLNAHERLDLAKSGQLELSVVPVWILMLYEVVLLLVDDGVEARMLQVHHLSLLLFDNHLDAFLRNFLTYHICCLFKRQEDLQLTCQRNARFWHQKSLV